LTEVVNYPKGRDKPTEGHPEMENDVVSSTDLQSSKEGPSYDLKDTTNRKSVLESIERSENIIQNDEYEGNDSAYSAGEESGRHFTVYDAVAGMPLCHVF
jgi:hypothetical protein